MTSDELLALATIIRHRDSVRLNVQRLTQELDRRALDHDLSKLRSDEVEGFTRINRAAREHPYGSAEYIESMRREKGPDGCITLHFSRNSHHPEFHQHVQDMGWLDIIEMVLDWKSASDTYGNNTFRDALHEQRKRFGFTPSQWWLIEQVVEWVDPLEWPAPPATEEGP